MPPEEAIATAKREYFPVSDWWLTGEILTFGCGDYYCTIPRTVIEETVPAWNCDRVGKIVKNRTLFSQSNPIILALRSGVPALKCSSIFKLSRNLF